MANSKAILNYASQYSDVKNYIGISQPTTTSNRLIVGDWVKIFFTGDGHIISHGVDYTPTFGDASRTNPLAKGLVPEASYATGQKLKFLGNDGQWKELTVAELPIADNITVGSLANGDQYIYNAKQVYDLFQDRISALDVMRFKGEFNPEDTSNFLIDGKCEAGDTYRVSHSGTYAGYELRAGDLLICILDKNSGATPDSVDSSDYWMVVEANIDGTTQHLVNGTAYEVFTSQPNKPNFDIYAPTTGGTQGEILVSTGDSAPEWRDKNTLDLISDSLKSTIAHKLSITSPGIFELTALDGTQLSKYTVEVGKDDWNMNITGLSAGTKNKLTLNTGLQFNDGNTDFNGSADRMITLMPASKTTIGGVIIDSTAGTIAPTQSTISVKTDGTIYLTYENICNALGFEPGDTTAVHNYNIILGNEANTTEYPDPISIANPFFNLTSTDEDNTVTSVAGSIQFIGNDSLKVTGSSNGVGAGSSLLFELQAANTDYLGGVKVSKNHTNALTGDLQVTADSYLGTRLYGVELDKEGKAFVYVPWDDTHPAFSTIDVIGGGDGVAVGQNGSIVANAVESTFSLIAGNGINLVADENGKSITINQNVWEVVKPDRMGYAPKMVGTDVEMNQQYYILSFTGNAINPTWNKLPSGAFKDTWRAIQVNDDELANTEAIDENGNIIGSALNFTSTGDYNKTTLTCTPSNDPNVANVLNIFSSWRSIYIEDTNYEVDKDYSLGFKTSDDLKVYQVLNTTDKVDYVAFELSWYNINEDAREVVEA